MNSIQEVSSEELQNTIASRKLAKVEAIARGMEGLADVLKRMFKEGDRGEQSVN